MYGIKKPLTYWFKAIWWFTTRKSDVNAINLKDLLGLGSYQTAVFTNVGQNMKIAREEIFGPVAIIMVPFFSEDNAIKLANDNVYGLCAMLWTQDAAKAMRIAGELCTGTVWINDSCALAPEPELP